LQVVVSINRFCHLGGVVDRENIQRVEWCCLRGTPYKLVIGLILQFPVAEREEHGMEFQSFGFVYGENPDSFYFSAWNCFTA
jgi:hypothetical protein